MEQIIRQLCVILTALDYPYFGERKGGGGVKFKEKYFYGDDLLFFKLY